MKVLQLIDSLNPGGAERIAVNYANGLADVAEASYLCTSRAEGLLKAEISPQVHYLFLKKSRSADLAALRRLKRFIRSESITIVHAHTTSYFLAAQLKCILPSIKIIWHEHHGARVSQSLFNNKVLYFSTFFFHKIIVVNNELRKWWSSKVGDQKVHYLPNFINSKPLDTPISNRDKQIICLANLRVPKNHLNLLNAFTRVYSEFPEWKLILIGQDFKDEYSNQLNTFIDSQNLKDAVILLVDESKVHPILQQGAIGVLSSDSEGLPMALLEYGNAGLAVVSTRVGQCEEVISTFGRTVDKGNSNALAQALIELMENESLRIESAEGFRNRVLSTYSSNNILPLLLKFYNH